MSERYAIIEWERTGQRAILSRHGWRVTPRDDLLSALLNDRFSLAETQRRRETLAPDLLATTARRAAGALNAEIIRYSPIESLAA